MQDKIYIKSIYLKKTVIINILTGIFAVLIFSGCKNEIKISNTPTPVPEITKNNSPAATHTPTPSALSTNAFVGFDSSYEIPEIIGNKGSNIENGGLSVLSDKRIYHINDGLYRMTREGQDEICLTDMTNIAYINDVGEYIYFISTHDSYIYRILKDGSKEAEQLPISNAYELLVIGDYMYYWNVDSKHIFKASLEGTTTEDLGFSGTNLCPDGAYLYFANVDDDLKLYRFNTVNGQIVKLRSDKARQINVVDSLIYYIDVEANNTIVSIERTGAGKKTVVDEACISLNNIDDILVFVTQEEPTLKALNTKNSEIKELLKNDLINGLNTAGNWIFFETYSPETLEAVSYKYDLVNMKIYPDLPAAEHIHIKNIEIKDEGIIITTDKVEYYEGDEAIKQYALDNDISVDDAKSKLSSEAVFYIRNKVETWTPYPCDQWAAIIMVTRFDNIYDNSEYDLDLETLYDMFVKNKEMMNKLLFEIVLIDNRIKSIKEIYCPIDDLKEGN